MSADRTVHVVDDDAAVRRSLERLLDTAGFHVVSYNSSSAFLEAARGLSAGCVLLDIQMPGVDGLAGPGASQPSGRPLAGDRDDGAWGRGESGAGDESGRGRFPREAFR